jgi:hypothetical protein
VSVRDVSACDTYKPGKSHVDSTVHYQNKFTGNNIPSSPTKSEENAVLSSTYPKKEKEKRYNP